VVSNGIRMVRGNLHYGVDRVVSDVVAASQGAALDERISVASGLRITDYMRGLADAVTTAQR
jgi:hypothetical protein